MINALGATLKDVIWVEVRRRGRWSLRRRGPTGWGKVGAQRMQRSHAIADSVTRGRDMAFRTNISSAMKFIVTHVVTMKACCPVAYMGVCKWFIVLGQGKIWGVRGAWFTRYVEVGGKSRTLFCRS